MKKDTRNQLLNEMKGGEDHYLFAVPEEGKIDLLSDTPEWEKITVSIGNEIQKEISREEYIQGLLEKIYSKNEKDTIQGIQSFVKYCLESEKNVYNDLFSKTTGKGQEIIENEALARELLNHCLGTRGRNKGFTQSQRKLLKQELFALNQTYEGDDVFSHLMTMMPASLQGASKIELMCKVSIMMLLIAQSHPEKFAKMDEFLEKQVVIDSMITGKTFSEMIDELLAYSGTYEAKNTGLLYNYRVDDLFAFAHVARQKLLNVPVFEKMRKKTRKQWIKINDPELELMETWYEELQRNFRFYHNKGFQYKELYTYCRLWTRFYPNGLYSTKTQMPYYLLDLRNDEINQIDVLYFIIKSMRKKLMRNFLFHYWQVKIAEEGLPQLDSGLVDLCLDTYHYDHKYFERILQGQQVTEKQQATLDKKRSEQEKLKNYNERLVIHRQAVRDTFEGQDDGIDRDAVFAFCNDPQNVYTTIDPNTGDISIRLPKCGPKGMKMKLMKTYDFPSHKKYISRDQNFLPKSKSQASQEFFDKSQLRTEFFKHRIDTESQGYFRDVNRFDTMMYYLAKQFGLGYNPKNMGEMQPVLRVYMAICGRVGREFLNRDRNGINGDRRGRVDNGYLDYIQFAFMDDRFQLLDRHDYGYDCASVMLLGDND